MSFAQAVPTPAFQRAIARSGLIAAVLAATLTHATSAARAEEFVVQSPIDGHPLHGEVDRPPALPRAMIVMYPGSGTHTRDVPSSPRGAARSFIFRDLSARLLRAGFGVVRYDERGIGCREGATPDDIGRCFDDEDARHISWTTLHSDALAVYRQAEAVAGGGCIIALGHSEGVVHIGDLIARGEARPVGVIAISGSFGPIDGVLRYQKVDLVPKALLAADSDHDGIVTRTELAAAFPHSALSRFGSPDRIAWPKRWSWPERGASRTDIAALRRAYLDEYRALAAEVLRHGDDEAYTVPLANGGSSVIAAYDWYKRFFLRGPPIMRLFSGYRGPIAAFFGGIDGNIDASAEAATLRAGLPAARLTIDLAPDVGHSLGEDASFGPMRADRQEAVVAAVERMAASCRR